MNPGPNFRKNPVLSGTGQWGPTMRDVADVLGVHPSTVSLALRDSPSISAATKHKVRQCAERLGYRPDPELVLFNAKRHSGQAQIVRGTIGFVTDLPSLAEIRRHPSLGIAVDSLTMAAKRVGYSLDLFHLAPGLRATLQLGRVLNTRSIQSIVLGMVRSSERLEGFDSAHFHGVRIESFQLASSFDLVSPDHRQAARLCMRELLKQGWCRPGLILRQDTPRGISELRMAGHLSEWARVNADWPPQPFFLPADRLAPCDEDLTRWFATGGFDCLICEDTVLPDVLARRLSSRGTPIPFACLDLPEKNGLVAGVDTLRARVGETAMKLLLATLGADCAMSGNQNHSTTFTPVQWCAGASAKPETNPL